MNQSQDDDGWPLAPLQMMVPRGRIGDGEGVSAWEIRSTQQQFMEYLPACPRHNERDDPDKNSGDLAAAGGADGIRRWILGHANQTETGGVRPKSGCWGGCLCLVDGAYPAGDSQSQVSQSASQSTRPTSRAPMPCRPFPVPSLIHSHQTNDPRGGRAK